MSYAASNDYELLFCPYCEDDTYHEKGGVYKICESCGGDHDGSGQLPGYMHGLLADGTPDPNYDKMVEAVKRWEEELRDPEHLDEDIIKTELRSQLPFDDSKKAHGELMVMADLERTFRKECEKAWTREDMTFAEFVKSPAMAHKRLEVLSGKAEVPDGSYVLAPHHVPTWIAAYTAIALNGGCDV